MSARDPSRTRTASISAEAARELEHPVPGLVLVFSAGKPRDVAIPLVAGSLTVGRGETTAALIEDVCLSRKHGEVHFDGGSFVVRDLGSRNGSSADGERIPAGGTAKVARVLRMGDSVFLPLADLRPFLCARPVQISDGWVAGPALQRAYERIAQAARFDDTLHIAGESGVGKEGAARAFHQHGPRAGGPFIAVNCAAIPEGVAERLLFGAQRGAYSGATGDAKGYVQAADGGTLFLDELAELDLSVQGKLLRVLESREVMALGALRPSQVDLRVCSATHRSLREQVAAGRLREDLYFRIGRPEVAIPPLRERLEEIPWLVSREIERLLRERGQEPLVVQASFVETCLLRPWPGNVREILTEARAALQHALAAHATRIEASHLGITAGHAFSHPPVPVTVEPVEPVEPSRDVRAKRRHFVPPDRAQIEQALQRAEGNVTRAARELGVHRNQLRRLIDEHQIDPGQFAPGGRTPP